MKANKGSHWKEHIKESILDLSNQNIEDENIQTVIEILKSCSKE